MVGGRESAAKAGEEGLERRDCPDWEGARSPGVPRGEETLPSQSTPQGSERLLREVAA